MLKLTEDIWNSIVYEKGNDGEIVTKRHRSISLPLISIKFTKQKVANVVKNCLEEYTASEIYLLIKKSINEVKDQYVETHDGFRIAKGVAREKRSTVGNIYAFARTAGYLLSFCQQ